MPGVYISAMRISGAGSAKREEADDNSPQQSTNSWPAPCARKQRPSSIAPGVPNQLSSDLRAFSICQAKLLEIDTADLRFWGRAGLLNQGKRKLESDPQRFPSAASVPTTTILCGSVPDVKGTSFAIPPCLLQDFSKSGRPTIEPRYILA